MIEKIKKIMNNYNYIREEEIATTKADFLTICTKRYYFKGGQYITRDTIIKPTKRAAMIIPKTTDNKYVMVIQPRVATEDGVTIEFPAGLINDNEKIIDGIKRELLEETGYQCENVKVLANYYQDCASICSKITIVSANNCYKISEQNLDEDELLTFVEVTYEDIKQLIDEKMIVDVNTLYCFELIKNELGIHD